ncbi:hypothetical protein AB4Y96_13195 [Phyllobacterium sp. TAF24]|uniref:hypothetical protein n=1 Tax=Phyllobacterium sp. TAF24 TaxID=3233068 RepID=UPI003F9D67D5
MMNRVTDEAFGDVYNQASHQNDLCDDFVQHDYPDRLSEPQYNVVSKKKLIAWGARGALAITVSPIAILAFWTMSTVVAWAGNGQGNGYANALSSLAWAAFDDDPLNPGKIWLGIGVDPATGTGSTQYYSAVADGFVAIAVGTGARAKGDYSTAFGQYTSAVGVKDTAFGFQAHAAGGNSTAIGPSAQANGGFSLALGNNAVATGNQSIALGSGAVAGDAVATTGMILGGVPYTFAGGAPIGTLSIGSVGSERTITNVAAGRLAGDSTDAINGSQLYASNQAIEKLVLTSGANAVQYDGDGTTKTDVTLGGAGAATAVKLHNIANGTAGSDAVNLSQLNAASGALGGGLSSTLGGGAAYNAATGTITGFSQPINAVSVLGAVDGTATPQTSVAGALAALNTNAVNTANIAVKYDAVGGNTITLGATGGAGAPVGGVKIANLANGVAATDAVNVSQLTAASGGASAKTDALGGGLSSTLGGGAAYNAATGTITGFSQVINSASINNPANPPAAYNSVSGALTALDQNMVGFNTRYVQSGNDLAGIFGGGAAFNSATGGFVGPTYTVQGQTVQGVQGAVNALNAGVTNVANGSAGLVQVAGQQLTVGAGVGGSAVNFTGTNGARKLVGVANGTIAQGSNEAVNGGQLYDVNQRIGAVEAVNNLGIKYDADPGGNATNNVTLVGANNGGAVTIKNVAEGINVTDAVNRGQLDRAISNVQATALPYDTDDKGNVDRTNLTFNRGGGAVVLHNIGAGTAGTDAVNLNQLNANSTADRGYTDTQVGGLRSDMDKGFASLDSSIRETRTEARQGIAAAMAMSSAPMPSAAGRTTWATNAATFRGEAAFGASVAHRFDTDNPFGVTGGVSWGGGGNVGVRVGMMGEF